jgi:hypothetical protein
LEALCLGLVLLTPGTDKIELLTNQLSIWRTARAIGAALAISSLWSVVFSGYMLSGATGPLPLWIVTTGVQFVLIFIALAISWAAYARACDMLFAMLYVIDASANIRKREATASS